MRQNIIIHSGTPHEGDTPHSGRYPWGSGKHPFQDEAGFLKYVGDLKEAGYSDSEIAHDLELSTSDFRDFKTIAKNTVQTNAIKSATELMDSGMSLNAVAARLEVSESTLRGWMGATGKNRQKVNDDVTSELERLLKAGYYVDIGEGSENHLGISRERLRACAKRLEDKGYKIVNFYQKQLLGKEKTQMKIIVPESHEFAEIMANKDRVVPPLFNIDDNGEVAKIEPPRAFPLSRIQIHYGDEVWPDGSTGKDKDGVIEVRRGVPGLSLGKAHYAQVRVNVDDKYYLKGMCVYADDLPDGVDIRVNSNKPIAKGVENALKPLKKDPENPFGAVIKMDDELILAQRHYTDPNTGKRELSYLNIVAEEGTWFEWKHSIASQMLSKQRPAVIKRQLNISYEAAARRVLEASRVSNPQIRAKILEDVAAGIDRDAINLKAAAFPRQASHVILPCSDLKPNEIYAPNYQDGETVVLIRYPHGGIFEIPQLVVNNHNEAAKRMIGNATDAVCIHPSAAEQLSGADFDGDTALVIPNNDRMIINHPALDALKGFDPGVEYPAEPKYPNGGVMTKKQAGMEMGKITNLITDMSLSGASFDEIARATRHSMVVIDCVKHAYDYEKSYRDNGIEELNIKYHGGPKRGAHTLISRTTSIEYLPEQREARGEYEVPPEKMEDWKAGKLVFIPTGRKVRDKKTGEKTDAIGEYLKGQIFDTDALLSGDNIEVENIYADYAKKMFSLANDCRKKSRMTPSYERNPSATREYSIDVMSIESKIADRKKKSPLERRAQILADADLSLRVEEDPGLRDDSKEFKKQASRCLNRARAKLNVGDVDIHLSDSEWKAVLAGALNGDSFLYLMRHCDSQELADQVFDTNNRELSDYRIGIIRQMNELGYSRQQIADHTGLSLRALKNVLEGGK